MDSFTKFMRFHFNIAFIFFVVGLLFGLVYSLNLLGITIDSQTLDPYSIRSIHISLMLYGFITLMLSMLPFLLIYKEAGYLDADLHYLSLFFIFWYIFLIYMIVSILFGNTRGLAFYDYAYPLNFILVIAGVFYAIALYRFIKLYEVTPLWVKVSFRVVLISPFMLVILMNPVIGQVQSTVSGPHGDNTLGMSLALIPLYYLIIKLLSKNSFRARWNILWIIPAFFYFSSVIYRSFFNSLSYDQEWFLQYLSLLYVPLLYRWYKDSHIEGFSKKALLISISAFLFVDIEGNILFIPQIRWLFHRNDLIIAHAHMALAIGVFFMVVAMFTKYIEPLKNRSFQYLYISGILGIFFVLTLSGLSQAGILDLSTYILWVYRTIFGLIVLYSLSSFVDLSIKKLSSLQFYNLIGILNDGFGGIFLILTSSYIYPLLGFSFGGKYEYIVFAFVSMTGFIHFLAFYYKEHSYILTKLTVVIRIFISSLFFALYISNILGIEALVICLFDFVFASVYLIFFNKKDLQRRALV